MLSEYNEAISCYTEAANKQKPLARVALLKRALALTELKKYDEALTDLNDVFFLIYFMLYYILGAHRGSQAFRGLLFQRASIGEKRFL